MSTQQPQMSNVLNLPPDWHGVDFQSVFDAIQIAHDPEALRGLVIQFENSTYTDKDGIEQPDLQTLGEYDPETHEIILNIYALHDAEFTLLHEIGHYIDHQILNTPRTVNKHLYASEIEKLALPFLEAIESSRPYLIRLRDLAPQLSPSNLSLRERLGWWNQQQEEKNEYHSIGEAILQLTSVECDALFEWVDGGDVPPQPIKDRITSLLNKSQRDALGRLNWRAYLGFNFEWFARAYAQLVAQDAPSTMLKAQLQSAIDGDHSQAVTHQNTPHGYPQQWKIDEFKPIGTALQQWFIAAGYGPD